MALWTEPVGQDRAEPVGQDRTEPVGQDRTEPVGQDQTDQHVQDTGHTAKRADDSLQLNTHAPYVCGFT